MACASPYYKKDNDQIYNFPCGKCYDCRMRRIHGWAFRIQKEIEQAESAHFVTLTYADENIQRTTNENATLVKADLQKFFKRLRKGEKQKIKYYAIGEYGDKTERPHYHILLLNTTIDNVEKSWSFGHCHFGAVETESIYYVLGYLNKPYKIPKNEMDDRNPEFSLMSKKLGISYINQNMKKWHKRDLTERYYIPLKDGKKIAMPRYYKEKIYNVTQRAIISQAQKNKLENQQDTIPHKKRLAELEKQVKLRDYKNKLFANEQRKTTI